MRISRIHIDSYGALKDRTFDLGARFNIFYGPNESGKTTTMEFIRNTLSPTTKRSLYPERSKLDSGTIRFSSDGIDKEVRLEQNSRRGEVPDILEKMDPQTYRSIFAMNSRDLDDMAVISSGEIRSKFLTIPGGESVPALMDSLEKDLNSKIGKVASSPSELNDITDEEERLQARMAELRSNAEEYSDLKQRSAVLEAELLRLTEESKSIREANRLYEQVESQRPAMEKLQSYRGELSELKKNPTADEGTEEIYRKLKEDSVQKKSAFQSLDQARKENAGRLGCDEAAARAARPNIDSLLYGQPEYDRRRSQPVVQVQPRKKPFPIIPIILIIAGIAMFLVPLDMSIRLVAATALIAAGIVAFFLTGRKADAPTPMQVQDQWVQAYENQVTSVMTNLGLPSNGTSSDLRTLATISSTLTSIDSQNEALMKARMEDMAADNKLIGFLSRYRGESGYEDAVKNTKDISILNSKIETLESSIRSAGFDPGSPLPEAVHQEYDDSAEREKSRELGQINERMNSVLDTKELDALIDRSYSLKARKEKTLKEGAAMMLSSIMLQDACTELYENVHPEVISTADRYLSMMTSGCYRFDMDPRNTELTIISDGVSKTSKKWSTGLRSQVLLSIKLAIAKEMGGGEIPVILDDVLLPFDSQRKEGACRALSALSEEMQVLLFTCDDRIPQIVRGMEGAEVVEIV